MKKPIFILVVALLCSYHNSYACDGCGCSASNYYFGVSPLFTKNFAEIRYRHSSFRSNLATKGTFQDAEPRRKKLYKKP